MCVCCVCRASAFAARRLTNNTPPTPPPPNTSNVAATELRMRRAAVASIYELMALATRTVEQFGVPAV